MPSVSCWSVLRDAQSIGDVSLRLLGMPAFSAYRARADAFGEQNAFWLGCCCIHKAELLFYRVVK